MTMLPAATHHDLSKQDQQQQSYGGFRRLEVEGYYYNQNICRESELLGSDMGEDDQSRSNSASAGGSKGNNNQINQQEQETRDEGWLQLSIGRQREGEELGGSSSPVVLDLLPHSNSQPCRPPLLLPLPPPQLGGSVAPLLNFSHPQLLPVQPPPSSPPPPPPPSNLLFQQFQYPHSASAFAPHLSHSNWAFAPASPFTLPSSSSSSSFPLSSHHLAASYFPRPFHFPPGFDDASAGPSSDVRVVDPPRRPHSGIWFMLQASPNQAKEPFLPQIPKSYLRIKDGKMTIRLLLKYLVNKLRLQSESEIEIRCRGQQLGPLLTLEHVRDNIWSPMMTPTLLSDSSTTDHIMVLYYDKLRSVVLVLQFTS
ncbi:protein LAX PANICLE 2 isoform X2 [Prosopis cineraria]|uniref:protein LAX PANICLE 2 isoform X2 n=1 Tax=Prosopis cineraria TaxID=364024 RepID=UPI00240FC28F|nr:protein LAX PANICLE 2 isoform X2 [Prosopis cineraria]